jgi:hypothetical protein
VHPASSMAAATAVIRRFIRFSPSTSGGGTAPRPAWRGPAG